MVRAGFFNLNPAVVRAEVRPRESGGCVVLLTAAAREGLINQKTAAGAAARLRRRLDRTRRRG